ncbi:MAG TPA: metal-binding protein [Methanosarcina sp.]|nr:metal-binding protein [Methanosarcina sp.]
MTENKDSLQENAQNPSKNKLGGTHTTIIGGRAGKKLIKLVSQHPEIKKIIPSVISVKGVAGGKLFGKVLRADSRGNLRLLLSEGRSFQEVRLVTTVGTAEEGDRIMNELNEIIKNAL